MTSRPAIRTDGLTKQYPSVTAVADLTLEVPEGSIHGFLGPNGAGKTTTLKILGGLIRPSSGMAWVDGIPLNSGLAYRRQVGFLSQEPRFFGWMTAREVLHFVASLADDPSAGEAGWIDRVLDRVGLDGAADRRTATYSGGMRQRLGIAQALVTRPRVLLLDEPVSALDPVGRREVLDLMADLKGEATVFYSTHILDDVERVSDHVAILDQGKLVRAAPTAELLASFADDRLRVALNGATDETTIRLAALPGVRSVEPAGREGDLRAYVLRIHPDRSAELQRAVMRLALDDGLTLAQNDLVRVDLEDAFLRLIGNKERAA
jgi:ABC-2 type transport system ATP-binding protein